jgi:hypothetical protein
MQSFDQMLLAWARKQPADAEYDYGSIHNCALCQFLKDTGICSTPRAGGSYWTDTSLPFDSRVEHRLSSTVLSALIGSTFGELTDAMLAARSEQPK